ncbi:unnamed protein product, partial [Rotaria sp. Silwood2]
GEPQGTVVAGGNGSGNRLDQLSYPRYVFVDRDHSVYVSDLGNDRVMKWVEDAKQGIVVAGGQGEGNGLTQLSCPQGVVVDQLGTVYVVDAGNDRIMRWPKNVTQGSVIVGGNGTGGQSNQFNGPTVPNTTFSRSTTTPKLPKTTTRKLPKTTTIPIATISPTTKSSTTMLPM